eukprot:jgi/Chrzof1/13506/Cz08g00110.t1
MQLVQLFGRVRDEWIASDLDGWLAPNAIYEGVAPALQAALHSSTDELYIVTTKQAHFTELLLQRMADVPLPAERIYSTTVSGAPKSSVLSQLAADHPGAKEYIFVEDKLSTLEKVLSSPETAGQWKLYLVDWGYNTPQEQQCAAANEHITVISVREFQNLLSGN